MKIRNMRSKQNVGEFLCIDVPRGCEIAQSIGNHFILVVIGGDMVRGYGKL